LAPTAWNFAGSARNSLISSSSSTASSAPATSEKVVFGVSLLAILALDLPNCITRLPPPCTELSRKKNSTPMMMNGIRCRAADSGTRASRCGPPRVRGLVGHALVEPRDELVALVADPDSLVLGLVSSARVTRISWSRSIRMTSSSGSLPLMTATTGRWAPPGSHR
jgi:hypothetical protein